MAKSKIPSAIHWFSRFILAFLLLLSGAGKLIDSSAAKNLIDVLVGENSFLMVFAGLTIIIVSIMELALAILLIINEKPQIVLYFVGAMITVFSLAIISLPLRGIQVAACGCFGALLPDGSIAISLLRNLGLLILVGASTLSLRQIVLQSNTDSGHHDSQGRQKITEGEL